MTNQEPQGPDQGHQSLAVVPTTHASRYLQQLCKHFGHKAPVEFDEQTGAITLPIGMMRLSAGDMALTVLCEATGEAELERLRQVAASHLNRFAFREGELAFTWQ